MQGVEWAFAAGRDRRWVGGGGDGGYGGLMVGNVRQLAGDAARAAWADGTGCIGGGCGGAAGAEMKEELVAAGEGEGAVVAAA